jgi:Domain of unknown function (DUF222)/HNH endonuclease
VPQPDELDEQELLVALDRSHQRLCEAQSEVLRLIREVERRGLWRGSGARSVAQWLSIRQGISQWKAQRWIAASQALENLPDIDRALSSGELGVDKVVELTRFASFESEAGLIDWAKRVSCAAVRRKADLETRSIEETREVERGRFVRWWFVDGETRFGLEAEVPAAQGATIARALERVAESLPVMPGEDDQAFAEARRADALTALCSSRLAEDADRATVIVHARMEDLVRDDGAAEIELGSAIHSETARRLLCDARVQIVIEDPDGEPLKIGRLSREPSPAMLRQLRYRDGECRFPGCGARRFTQAHHIVWWSGGGRTDIDNLLLVCSFHHKLVHELGWSITRSPEGKVEWFTPGGTRYRAGPIARLDAVASAAGH